MLLGSIALILLAGALAVFGVMMAPGGGGHSEPPVPPPPPRPSQALGPSGVRPAPIVGQPMPAASSSQWSGAGGAASQWGLQRPQTVLAPRGPLQRELSRAGLSAQSDAAVLFGAKIGLASLMGLTAAFFLQGTDLPPLGAQLLSVGPALVGFSLPGLVLTQLATGRRRRLQRHLPDLLDLLVTCLEGGLGVDYALQRATGELRGFSPELADEIDRTVDDEVAGTPRHVALSHLRDRTGLPDVGELFAAIDEARSQGTSISSALREQAASMRKDALARSLVWSRKVPFFIAITMLIFALPAVFAVLLGPTLVTLVRTAWPS